MAKNKFNLNIVLIALWAGTLLFSLNLATALAQVVEVDSKLRAGQSSPNLGPRPITETVVFSAPPLAPPASGAASPPLPNQVEVGQAILVHDPATPDIVFWFPAGAITEPVEVRSYRSGLPPGVNRLTNLVDSPFFFGAWVLGQGRTTAHFDQAVLINILYDDTAIRTIPEEQLRLMLYVQSLQGWTRLCGAVDVHGNVVSGLITDLVPLEPEANSLFGLSLIDTSPLLQRVNDAGVTTLVPDRDDFRLYVLPDTVHAGVYFEITSLPRSLHNGSVQLVSDPVDIKACAVDHTNLQQSTQLAQFSKPLRLEFQYTTAMANRAGGADNLTVVTLQDDHWINVEDIGSRPQRNHTALTVDVDYLGTFSLAVR